MRSGKYFVDVTVDGKRKTATCDTLDEAIILRSRVLNQDGRNLFPYSYNELRHKWDNVRGLMGLSEDQSFTIHCCRHTCCSRLVRKGVPLPTVQKWMGHKRIETTMRYAHLMPSDLFSAVAALEGFTDAA
ncbi:tyrosine-type recombinase/integrase [Pseudothioclava arenosa]|uniref:tyrosine-type recombinase/integrase n=1 Tax=Pseudothioclava arenosa TaxID=1795308 RepID=UPI0015C7CFAB|nr:tyrosine-type recombinase/integrase [Pseudothioclava arenosa]